MSIPAEDRLERVRRLLGRMNSKTGGWLVDAGGDFGGLTVSDIAAAGAGADRLGWLVAVYRWSDHRDIWDEMARALDVALSAEFVRLGWKIKRGTPYLRGLGRAALTEVTTPKKCGACRGRGQVYKRASNGGLAEYGCSVCGGQAERPYSRRNLAESVGIPESTWRKHCADKYEHVRQMVVDAETRALLGIWDALR